MGSDEDQPMQCRTKQCSGLAIESRIVANPAVASR